jgi:hypothetical protein
MARNPQDSTRRNVAAGNKKIAALTVRVRKLEEWNRLFRRRLRDKKR